MFCFLPDVALEPSSGRGCKKRVTGTLSHVSSLCCGFLFFLVQGFFRIMSLNVLGDAGVMHAKRVRKPLLNLDDADEDFDDEGLEGKTRGRHARPERSTCHQCKVPNWHNLVCLFLFLFLLHHLCCFGRHMCGLVSFM